VLVDATEQIQLAQGWLDFFSNALSEPNPVPV
jgi:hypothetical protein